MSVEATLRELMLALEFARVACEHATGNTRAAASRLGTAMSVATRVLDKHRALAADFQHDSWWKDVRALPLHVGASAASSVAKSEPIVEPKHDWVWVLRGVGYDHYRCRHCAADWMDGDPVPDNATCQPPRVERIKRKR